MRKGCFRLLLAFAVLLSFAFAVSPVCMARGTAKIISFDTSIQADGGVPLFRIELGLNKPIEENDISVEGGGVLRPKRLKIVMKDVKRDSDDVEEGYSFDKNAKPFARGASFLAKDSKELQLTVAMTALAEEGNYRVYTMPKDKKNKKPFRIVIDIYDGETNAKGKVDGVGGRTIVIDPGHGGTDTGARGYRGSLEKDITLKVSKNVEKILKASGATVVMTRDDDRDVYGPSATDAQELQARVDYGDFTQGTDIFVSIHCNAFYTPESNGTGTYYYYKTELDEQLAQAIQDGMVDRGGRRDRGIHEARFYVCRNSSMPAALCELAFITNPDEELLLSDEDFQFEMAMGICEGISNFFKATGY